MNGMRDLTLTESRTFDELVSNIVHTKYKHSDEEKIEMIKNLLEIWGQSFD